MAYLGALTGLASVWVDWHKKCLILDRRNMPKACAFEFMLNPFIELTQAAESERKRRERLKIGVYSFLMAATLLLMGLLIQGCRAEQKSDTPTSKPTVLSDAALPPATHAPVPDAQPQTNSEPTPMAAATVPTNVAPPAVEPAANPAPASPAPVNEPPVAPATTTYVVKRGDTLTAIAKKHGTTVKALKAANRLKTDQILVGKLLKLPAPVSSRQTS